MFTATGHRIYFRKIRIVIPITWSKKPEYSNVPAPSLSKQYIVVDDDINKVITPHVKATATCGAEGTYLFLSAKEFILENGRTRWGSHGESLLFVAGCRYRTASFSNTIYV